MSVRGPQAFMALYLATLLLQVAAVLLGWLVRDGQAAESCAETAIP